MDTHIHINTVSEFYILDPLSVQFCHIKIFYCTVVYCSYFAFTGILMLLFWVDISWFFFLFLFSDISSSLQCPCHFVCNFRSFVYELLLLLLYMFLSFLTLLLFVGFRPTHMTTCILVSFLFNFQAEFFWCCHQDDINSFLYSSFLFTSSNILTMFYKVSSCEQSVWEASEFSFYYFLHIRANQKFKQTKTKQWQSYRTDHHCIFHRLYECCRMSPPKCICRRLKDWFVFYGLSTICRIFKASEFFFLL